MCPSTRFSRTNCSLSRYNAKGKLTCFNCKTGVFLTNYSLQTLQKKAITIHVLGEKLSPLWGIFNNYKEALRVSRVEAAALIES